jgi:hypothetical protein
VSEIVSALAIEIISREHVFQRPRAQKELDELLGETSLTLSRFGCLKLRFDCNIKF